jgi:hypothetical protein
MLSVASARVAWRPRSRTARVLGDPRPATARDSLPAGACAEAWRVGRAVDRVAAALPWHPLCLPRAAAAAWMLRRRKIDCEAHLGIIDTKPPSAHAWVTVGGVVVQGGPTEHVTELALFV